MFLKLDREYEVKCTLGTIRDIENRFGKSFFEIVKNIQNMTTDEQIKLLYIGVKRADGAVKESDFLAECEDKLGFGDLMEALEKYLYSLQYPGLSAEEVQSKVAKKLEQNRLNKDLIG